MTMLIACLSIGKGSWAQLNQLLSSEVFDKALLITNRFGAERFTHERAELIELDLGQQVQTLRDAMREALAPRLTGETEVALNLSSGSGSEHMALLAALLKLGVAIRLVTAGEGGVDEL